KPLGDPGALGERLLRTLACQQRAAQFPRNASAKANNPLAMVGQQLFVDPRLVIKAFEKRTARQFYQILKTNTVLGEQGKVVTRLLARHGPFLVEPAPRRNVGLVADNRVDLGVAAST